TLGIALPLDLTRGSMTLDAEALLDEQAATLQTLSGTAEFTDAEMHMTPARTPLMLAFGGKLRFSCKPPLVQVEFQPGLRWQLMLDGGQPLQASGQLVRTFAVHADDQGVHNEGGLPFALNSAEWGQWDVVARDLRLKKGEKENSASGWSVADVDLRIEGRLAKWQRDKLQLRDLRAAGDVGLHWSTASGLRSELALQLGFGKASWSGNSSLHASPSSWKVNATATAKAFDDLWLSLVIEGEASSPKLKMQADDGQTLTLGATRLQWSQVHPAKWQNLEAGGGDVELSARDVRYGSWPAPDLRARLRPDAGTVHADGSLQWPGNLPKTEALHFAASHTLAHNCGAATLTTRQKLPTLGTLWQPRPPALLALEFQAGDADARFMLDWCLGAKRLFNASGTAQVRGSVLGWDKARVEAVEATLQLDGLNPLRARIQLAAKRGELATGTALTDLDVDLALTASELDVRAFDVGLLGGNVHLSPLRLPWPPTEQTLPLEIRAIDLGQLLALAGVDGLSASGRLGGVLPLSYRDGSVEIDNGQLDSQGAGTIKYVPSATLPDNPGLQALRNFHFEQLGTRLFYAADGAYRIQAKLEGSNPDFYDGYPVRFRLNINGQLPGLFRSAVFSGDFDRHILEQLQSGKLE
ncbi:MAG: YdbH domain-containing protein, partial [Propionivibrio sp.]